MTRSTRTAAPLILVVVWSLAAACGGGGGGASTGSAGTRAGGTAGPVGTKPACQFFTTDEIKAILGNPVKPGAGEGIDCAYNTDVDGGTSMNLTVDRPGRSDIRRVCQAELASLPPEYKREDVGGVGTTAVWVWTALAKPLVQGILTTCSADSWVMVQLTGEKDQSKFRDTAADIARRTYARV